MSITTFDGLLAAAKQYLVYYKIGGISADWWSSMFGVGGNPGAGTLAVGNTANGVVPTSASTGFPPINAFAGGAIGYLGRVDCGSSSSIACNVQLFDCLFRCGAYAFNASTTLTSQPSYSARVPSGSYVDLQIWIEGVTAFTGTPTFTVTYTNESGTTGRTTGAVAGVASYKLGRMQQLQLQSGDAGVQKIESVTCTGASAGTFNVLVLRPLWFARLNNPETVVTDISTTGMPILYADSALYVAANPGSNTLPEMDLDLVVLSG